MCSVETNLMVYSCRTNGFLSFVPSQLLLTHTSVSTCLHVQHGWKHCMWMKESGGVQALPPAETTWTFNSCRMVCVFRGVPLWLRGRGVVFVLSGQNWRVRLDAPQRRHTRHQIHPEHRTELRPRRLQKGYKHENNTNTQICSYFYLWLC